MTHEEFKKAVDADKFLEYAQFAGNFYGTKEKFIKQKFEEGLNIILEIETQGALQVKNKMPEAVLIFIAPPGEGVEELENVFAAAILKMKKQFNADLLKQKLN